MNLRPIALLRDLTIVALASASLSLCAQTAIPQATPAPQSAATASAPAKPAPPASAPVQVTSSGNQLQVKVPDQAPLSEVLTSVCREQKVKCTGLETLTTYRGPAMSVDGTLRQVISKLLEGTDVNYEFSRATEGGATAIAFLGHAPKGTAPVPTAPTPEKPDHPTFLHSRPFPGNPQQQPPAPPPDSKPQSQVMPANPGGSNAEGAASSQPEPDANAAAEALFVGSGDNTPAKFLPFPDQHGNPVPVDKTPATAQPFPDKNGKPIPIKPSPGGSPFPTNTSNNTTQNSSNASQH